MRNRVFFNGRRYQVASAKESPSGTILVLNLPEQDSLTFTERDYEEHLADQIEQLCPTQYQP
jgi:hypothetical protein